MEKKSEKNVDQPTEKLKLTQRKSGGKGRNFFFDFTLPRQDHTLGNLLTCQLQADPQVRFAAYRHNVLDEDVSLSINFKQQTSKKAAVQKVQHTCAELTSELDWMSQQFKLAMTRHALTTQLPLLAKDDQQEEQTNKNESEGFEKDVEGRSTTSFHVKEFT